MPTLPLPALPAQIGAGDLPVSDETDVLALFPDYSRVGDSALVRDGLVAALTAMLLTFQERAGNARELSDILTATGSSLDGLFNERGVFRAKNESDTAYRARGLALPSLVTPTAILAAVNTILAAHTTIKAQYFESIQDRWYVRRASVPGGFRSFVYRRYTANPSSPYYPDRLYEDDSVENGGRIRVQSNPGGARVFADQIGRLFVLRVPDLSSIDGDINAVFIDHNGAHPLPPTRTTGLFVYAAASGGSPYGAYIRTKSATALDVYQAIVSTVERIKGASIRWRLQVDRTLQ